MSSNNMTLKERDGRGKVKLYKASDALKDLPCPLAQPKGIKVSMKMSRFQNK